MKPPVLTTCRDGLVVQVERNGVGSLQLESVELQPRPPSTPTGRVTLELVRIVFQLAVLEEVRLAHQHHRALFLMEAGLLLEREVVMIAGHLQLLALRDLDRRAQ